MHYMCSSTCIVGLRSSGFNLSRSPVFNTILWLSWLVPKNRVETMCLISWRLTITPVAQINLSLVNLSVPINDGDYSQSLQHKTLLTLLTVVCASRSVWILLETNFYAFDCIFYFLWMTFHNFFGSNKLSCRILIPMFVTALSAGLSLGTSEGSIERCN